jgi:phosphatidylserine decarboxylase
MPSKLATPNQRVNKGDEQAFFGFGGSTLVMLSESGRVSYDDDLLQNSQAGLETYIRLGARIGIKSARSAV